MLSLLMSAALAAPVVSIVATTASNPSTGTIQATAKQIIAALSAISLASIAQGAPSTQLSALAAVCPRPISPISCA